jgi:hypothetical protein
MDDVWIGNTFSLYSCLVSIHGGKLCTNHPHSSIYLLPFPIYLSTLISTYVPYLLTYGTPTSMGSLLVLVGYNVLDWSKGYE